MKSFAINNKGFKFIYLCATKCSISNRITCESRVVNIINAGGETALGYLLFLQGKDRREGDALNLPKRARELFFS